MLRKRGGKLTAICQLEIFEIEPGRNRTTDQGVSIWVLQLGCKPAARGHTGLQSLSTGWIIAQPNRLKRPIRSDNVNQQPRSRIEMPELIGGDAVECGKILSVNEEVDGRGCRASSLKCWR
jgi:hypothetical protein